MLWQIQVPVWFVDLILELPGWIKVLDWSCYFHTTHGKVMTYRDRMSVCYPGFVQYLCSTKEELFLGSYFMTFFNNMHCGNNTKVWTSVTSVAGMAMTKCGVGVAEMTPAYKRHLSNFYKCFKDSLSNNVPRNTPEDPSAKYWPPLGKTWHV